ncbi:hypothetical protein M9458_016596, partial [Cirrhinus mrigala]
MDMVGATPMDTVGAILTATVMEDLDLVVVSCPAASTDSWKASHPEDSSSWDIVKAT